MRTPCRNGVFHEALAPLLSWRPRVPEGIYERQSLSSSPSYRNVCMKRMSLPFLSIVILMKNGSLRIPASDTWIPSYFKTACCSPHTADAALLGRKMRVEISEQGKTVVENPLRIVYPSFASLILCNSMLKIVLLSVDSSLSNCETLFFRYSHGSRLIGRTVR